MPITPTESEELRPLPNSMYCPGCGACLLEGMTETESIAGTRWNNCSINCETDGPLTFDYQDEQSEPGDRESLRCDECDFHLPSDTETNLQWLMKIGEWRNQNIIAHEQPAAGTRMVYMGTRDRYRQIWSQKIIENQTVHHFHSEIMEGIEYLKEQDQIPPFNNSHEVYQTEGQEEQAQPEENNQDDIRPEDNHAVQENHHSRWERYINYNPIMTCSDDNCKHIFEIDHNPQRDEEIICPECSNIFVTPMKTLGSNSSFSLRY